MTYKVAIKHNPTGEVRFYTHSHNWDPEIEEYIWEDGNYSCDCNRHLFFHRAINEEPYEDCPCGETRYSILYIELPDGSRPYQETAGDGNPHPTTTEKEPQ